MENTTCLYAYGNNWEVSVASCAATEMSLVNVDGESHVVI